MSFDDRETEPLPDAFFERSGLRPPAPTREELEPFFPRLAIGEKLGSGGCGTVFRARQRTLDRPVALKILATDLAADEGFVARFKREARTLAVLQHPNIVTVFDAGQAGPYLFLVMEYVAGQNLRERALSGPVPPAEVLSIARGLCQALQFAHDQGIVHRDIKPENILIDASGHVKVADFGLAKVVGTNTRASVITRTSQIMGTPQYMAPEQYETPTTVDRRVDLYALGVVLYELLTGRLPLGRFEPPSAVSAGVEGVDNIILRALERDVAKRYQNARDLETDLATLVTPPPQAAPKPRSLHLPPIPKRRARGSLPFIGSAPEPSGSSISLIAAEGDEAKLAKAIIEVSACSQAEATRAIARMPALIGRSLTFGERQWIRARLEAFGGVCDNEGPTDYGLMPEGYGVDD